MLAPGRQRIAQHLDHRSGDGTPDAPRFDIASARCRGKQWLAFMSFSQAEVWPGLALAQTGNAYLLMTSIQKKQQATLQTGVLIICASVTWQH